MDVLGTIFTRTSYRGAYTEEKVPREDLKTILEAGLAAPSGCNKQTTSLIAAAIENMLLAIKALGYESCWYEGHITDEDAIGRKMADLLGVPGDMELVCFLPIGKAAEKVERTAKKKEFSERAWFNGYQRREE